MSSGSKARLRQAGGARGGEQDQPAGRAVAPESGPGVVAAELRQVVIVHGGPADALVVDRKAAGLDDVERHAQAGGKTNESAEILRYIGLVQSEAH